jgi:hypothetical protein
MCYQLRQGEAICIAVTPVFPGKVQGDVLLLEPKPTGFLILSRCFVANHVVPVRLVVLHLFVKLFIRLVSETPEITFSKIVGQSTCMFELLFYSLLDRVTFIYFYVFAIALRPCCIICTLLHCGDWFSFVSGYVADMPFRVHRSNND